MSEEPKDSTSETVKVKPLRPALIASEHTFSEYSIFLEHLLVGLVDESVATALVCPPACDVDSVISPTVEVIRHPVFNLPLFAYQNRKILAEQLAKFRPTVLHCLCDSQATLSAQLAKQLGLPYVLTVTSLQKRFSRFSISSKRCTKITVPARSIAANIATVCPIFGGRVEEINFGTFVEDSCGCFSKLGRPASMVATHPLDNADDFENLLGAIRHLAIEGYEFMLVLRGGGRAERGVRKLLGELGLSQIVVIVPRLSPWRFVLAAGDIFIQPQPNDAFDPLLLEAMSVGAAVAGCKGGVDDLIIEGQTGVVFDPADELSIYGSLQQLFDRPEFARQLAKGAQEHLRENYSVSKMVTAILRAYREAQNTFAARHV